MDRLKCRSGPRDARCANGGQNGSLRWDGRCPTSWATSWILRVTCARLHCSRSVCGVSCGWVVCK
eukprot:7142862-Prymnesium_polylepis.1